ncbi:MAG: 1-acyl-sn-glycerol-3-phosphate acyltransferase [Caulobacterales bacterium]|nr:1-acyl-sn-glycerol-3-phosphate acyltransferase [Caulobacterales bacterium]
MLRSIAFVIWMYGLLAVMSVLCSPTFLMPRAAGRACLNLWLRLVFAGLRTLCGVTYEVRGREHVPTGGALVASKHQSMFETLAFWRILDDPAIILKRELAWLPFFGWYALKLGNISVDRSAKARALRAILRAAKARAGEGRQIIIFPEGTRVVPGAPSDYKPGVAALYGELGAPCAPVALNSGLYWPARGVRRRPGHIIIEFLEPIAPGLTRREFMRTLEERIESATNALLAGSPAPAPTPQDDTLGGAALPESREV